ncbi:MAG TPA: GGDEF domain-containing protein [Longimicrobiales bacterium]
MNARLLLIALPGAILSLAAGSALAFAADSPLLAQTAQAFPYAALIAAALLAWRLHSTRLFVANALLASVYIGLHPALFADHPLAHALLAICVPVGFGLLACAHDRGFSAARLRRHGALAFAPLIVAAFFTAGSTERAQQLLMRSVFDPIYSDWSGLPEAAVLAIAIASALIGVRIAQTRRAPEAALLWLLLASAGALIAPVSSTARGIWTLTGALIIVVALIESAYSMAFDDELTALPGRRALTYALNSLRAPYAIAIVDVDHFKSFNDRYGHDVGDQVLRMVASHLQAVGGNGCAYRSGGEEFTIVFPGLDKSEALRHVEEVREAIAEARFALRRRRRPRGKKGKTARGRGAVTTLQLQVTISVGIAAVSPRHDSVEAVVQAADKAMYRAKSEGRNRVVA